MRILHEAETPTIETAARPRTSMIAVKCVKGLVASALLEGSAHAEWSHACLKQHLFKKELFPPSTFLNG